MAAIPQSHAQELEKLAVGVPNQVNAGQIDAQSLLQTTHDLGQSALQTQSTFDQQAASGIHNDAGLFAEYSNQAAYQMNQHAAQMQQHQAQIEAHQKTLMTQQQAAQAMHDFNQGAQDALANMTKENIDPEKQTEYMQKSLKSLQDQINAKYVKTNGNGKALNPDLQSAITQDILSKTDGITGAVSKAAVSAQAEQLVQNRKNQLDQAAAGVDSVQKFQQQLMGLTDPQQVQANNNAFGPAQASKILQGHIQVMAKNAIIGQANNMHDQDPVATIQQIKENAANLHLPELPEEFWRHAETEARATEKQQLDSALTAQTYLHGTVTADAISMNEWTRTANQDAPNTIPTAKANIAKLQTLQAQIHGDRAALVMNPNPKMVNALRANLDKTDRTIQGAITANQNKIDDAIASGIRHTKEEAANARREQHDVEHTAALNRSAIAAERANKNWEAKEAKEKLVNDYLAKAPQHEKVLEAIDQAYMKVGETKTKRGKSAPSPESEYDRAKRIVHALNEVHTAQAGNYLHDPANPTKSSDYFTQVVSDLRTDLTSIAANQAVQIPNTTMFTDPTKTLFDRAQVPPPIVYQVMKGKTDKEVREHFQTEVKNDVNAWKAKPENKNKNVSDGELAKGARKGVILDMLLGKR